MSTERLTTVAEVVASLPPIAELLGIDDPGSASNTNTTTSSHVTRYRGKAVHSRPRNLKTPTSLQAPDEKPLPPLTSGRRMAPTVHPTALVPCGSSGTSTRMAAVESARRLVQEDRLAWHRIRQSLELPLVNRSQEDVMSTLAYLRRIPFFAESAEDDLLSVAAEMELVDTRGTHVEVARVALVRRAWHADVRYRGPSQDETEDAELEGTVDTCVGMGPSSGKRHRLVSTLGHSSSPHSYGSPGAKLVSARVLGRPQKKPPVGGIDAATDAAFRQIESLQKAMEEKLRETPEAEADAAEDAFRPVVAFSAVEGTSVANAELGDAASEEDEDGECEEELLEVASLDPLMTLVEGKLLLELPSANGKEYFPLVPGDTFGYTMLTAALPSGARYITLEPCLFLRVQQPQRRSRKANVLTPLRHVLARAVERIFQRQLNFLLREVRPPLFEEPTTARRPVSGRRRSTRHGSKAPQDPNLVQCARSLIPLRLTDNQLLAVEGEASDALFLVWEGKLAVSRVVPLSATHRPENTATTAVMEVATLTHGEVCGELGLLGYNPDVRPGEGVLWSDDYWREALLGRFKTAPDALDGTNAKFLKELQGGRSEEDTAAAAEREMEKRALFAEEPAPRMATISSHNASLVYRLDYQVCREVFGNVAVTRLREYAKGYPSVDDLRDRYDQQRAWDVYKKAVYQEALDIARKR